MKIKSKLIIFVVFFSIKEKLNKTVIASMNGKAIPRKQTMCWCLVLKLILLLMPELFQFVAFIEQKFTLNETNSCFYIIFEITKNQAFSTLNFM